MNPAGNRGRGRGHGSTKASEQGDGARYTKVHGKGGRASENAPTSEDSAEEEEAEREYQKCGDYCTIVTSRRCCEMAAHRGITHHVKWSRTRSMTFSVVPIVLTFTYYLESKVNILLFTEKVRNNAEIYS